MQHSIFDITIGKSAEEQGISCLLCFLSNYEVIQCLTKHSW